MSEQLTIEHLLFLTLEPSRSRHSDPESSHRAERRMRVSGAMRGQALIAFELVRKYPGRTSKELATLGTLDRYQLARRLSDLLNQEQVRRVEPELGDCRWWVK